jgi:UDP-N-acetylmuramyl pentapeptide phosphotransferase/UDP-N-acetylglucosamine-1-phosphate transferase
MMSMLDGLILLVTLAISWSGSSWLASHRNPLRIMDQPNERSLHDVPTPRAGGVAILFSLLVGWGWLGYSQKLPEFSGYVAVSLACVAGISLLDDHRGISPLFRLLAHGVAATCLVLVLPGGWFVLLVAWFATVWLINLYNFMDGIDGLAGGMALIGFGSLGLIAWLNGHQLYSIYAWTVAAAVAGFLVLNWPPAKIFMGDVGSAGLGLLIAIFWVWAVRDKIFAAWLPALIFSPFIVDATVTLLHRAWRRERVWEAHRGHYYQKLVQMGWGHRKTVLLEYCLMLICAATAILLNVINVMLLTVVCICLLILLYLLLAHRVYCYERMLLRN